MKFRFTENNLKSSAMFTTGLFESHKVKSSKRLFLCIIYYFLKTYYKKIYSVKLYQARSLGTWRKHNNGLRNILVKTKNKFCINVFSENVFNVITAFLILIVGTWRSNVTTTKIKNIRPSKNKNLLPTVY